MATTDSSIIPFQFEAFIVRTVMVDGQPWFVAKDVADALGYADSDQAVKKNCKKANSLKNILSVSGTDSKEIKDLRSSTLLIPESDVYRLTLRSTLPDAERFQDWVCEEVLPQIRKTGRYVTQARQGQSVLQDCLKRAAQLAASKTVNGFNFEHGGKAAVIQWNVDNCVKQTNGLRPSALKEIAKDIWGIPAKNRTSGKEVVRFTQPHIAAAQTAADLMLVSGAERDKALDIAYDMQPIFQRMIAAGVRPAELDM